MNSTEPVSSRRSVRRSAVTLLRGLIFSWIAFLNDRLLPVEHPLDAQAVWDRMEGLLAWCERFLAQHDPGPTQYRGRPMQPQNPTSQTHSVPFRYRGLVVERQIPITGAATSPQPYIPPYQRRLSLWMLNLGFADTDRYSTTPDLEPSYRGQKI